AQNLNLAAALGFGGIEVGTITPKPQSGNPRPRMFRLIEEQSLQNAMGFNNSGSEAVAQNLAPSVPFVLPVGVNIGKNKDTPNEQSLNDYAALLRAFAPLADYLVVNVSSPNTPNLRDLQNDSFVSELFCLAKTITHKPILLKIAPDMPSDALLCLCENAVRSGASGIIATNTTIDYALSKNARNFGGISGQLLCSKSAEILRILSGALFGKTLLISAGGVHSAEEAYMRLRAGASCVQLYSALVYEGPSLVYRIKKGLLRLLLRDGFAQITEAIGADVR
ncbi:MAG: dihydroorotate dehydrogenase (quinone), partial [Helicobacter sp.]|nr:dihydroorotate dehydrogenase (quinone) [Helicobacter sp.]